MKKFVGVILTSFFALALFYPMNYAYAVGTVAGTTIEGKATATYQSGTNTITKESNVTTIKVAEILNVSVTWQDAGDVSVEPGDSNKKLLFKITNTGNGPEKFSLSGVSNLAEGQFHPKFNLIYIDDGDGVWNPAQDHLYNPSNDATIDPDGNILVWVDSDIPAKRPDDTDIQDGDVGKCQITAACATGSGSAGTVFAGKGQSGTDAVVGTTTGSATASGNYAIINVVVALIKTQNVVSNPVFESQPVPGAEIEYTITVQVTSGKSTAKNMIIKDPIPTGTTYKPGSITLNNVNKGDGIDDSDGCDFNITNTNSVTVQLGNMTSATPVQAIKFIVTVN